MEYTKRRNLNRGYLKLEVWQRGMDLFEMAWRLAGAVSDFHLISALESQRATDEWQTSLATHPPIQSSNHPTIQSSNNSRIL
jgi:hypothetical protein